MGVSESSLKRWCDQGLLPTIRTAGGHRRLPVNAVMNFLRKSGKSLVRPEVLGLPSVTGRGDATLERARQEMTDALIAGDDEAVRRITFDLYLAKIAVVDICDLVIAQSFHTIGDQWECGDVEVYQERRACDICVRALHELATALPTAKTDAPLAIGGTFEGDQYQLPTLMVELSLRDAGWNAKSFGNSLPSETLCKAIDDLHPRLFWLSVSRLDSPSEFLERYHKLLAYARQTQVAIVVGGHSLTPEIRRQMQYAAFCDNLRHLRSFAETIQTKSSG